MVGGLGFMHIFIILAPLIIMVTLGYLSVRIGFLPTSFYDGVSRLLYYFLMPATIFYSLWVSDITHLVFSVNIPLILSTYVVTLLISGVFLLFIRTWNRPMRVTLWVGSIRTNAVYIAFPIVYAAYGVDGLAILSIVVMISSILTNFYSVITYGLLLSTHSNIISAVLKTTRNPILIAVTFGIVFSIVGVPVATVADTTFTMISNAMSPLALLFVGSTIDFRYIKGNRAAIAFGVFMKMVLFPSTFLALSIAFDSPLDIHHFVILLMLAAPLSLAHCVLTSNMGGDRHIADATLVVSLIVSLGTYPVWLYIIHMFG